MNTIYSNVNLDEQVTICYEDIIKLSNTDRVTVFTYNKDAAGKLYNLLQPYYFTKFDLKACHTRPYYSLIPISGPKVDIIVLTNESLICGSHADHVYLLEADKILEEDWICIAPMFYPNGGARKIELKESKSTAADEWAGSRIIENEKIH